MNKDGSNEIRMLLTALEEYGQKEIVGKENNPRILEYHRTTGGFSDDETPWCSSFVNWCATQAGLERTGRANARSWLNIGEVTESPLKGDIVVFKRGNSDWQGHVAIYINKVGNLIYVLGGNQGNMVNISAYKESDLLGYRKLKSV